MYVSTESASMIIQISILDNILSGILLLLSRSGTSTDFMMLAGIILSILGWLIPAIFKAPTRCPTILNILYLVLVLVGAIFDIITIIFCYSFIIPNHDISHDITPACQSSLVSSSAMSCVCAIILCGVWGFNSSNPTHQYNQI
jgi:hypothetical protein